MNKRKILYSALTTLSVCAIAANPMVVKAETTSTESNVETTTTTEENKVEQSVVVIKLENTTDNSMLTSSTISIVDRKNGKTLSFTRTSAGNYVVDADGNYTELEPSNKGTITILGLNGTYSIEDNAADSNYHCTSESKTLVIAGSDSKEVSMTYIVNSGDLVINVLSEDDTSIADAEFTIKDVNGNVITFTESNGTYTYMVGNSGFTKVKSNTAGRISVNKLPAGTYTVEQVSKPAVYNGELIVKTVVVTNQNTASLSIVNEKLYGDLIVNITDENNSSKALSNSVYRIKLKDGSYLPISKVSDGSYTFNRGGGEYDITAVDGTVSVAGIPAGSYSLEEVKAPSGYRPTSLKSFDIAKNSKTTLSVTNVRSTGHISINLTDEATGDTISGFTFSIINPETKEAMKFKVTEEGFYTYAAEGETEFVTNKDGKITFVNIPTGKIIVKQMDAADGYIISTDTVEQEISQDLETVYNVTTSKSNSTITIVNSDADPLKDVKVEVFDAEGNKVCDAITNENGKYLFTDLESGEYTLKVTSVPSTYELPEDVKFTVNEKGIAEGLGKITLNYNELKFTTGIKTAGIQFALINEAGEEIAVSKTDAEGIAYFAKLPFGNYKVVQKTAAEGYEVSTEECSIVIDDKYDNKTEAHEFKATAIVVEEKSNGGLFTVLGIVAAACAGIGGFFVYKKKKGSTAVTTGNTFIGIDENGNEAVYKEVEVEVEVDENGNEINRENNPSSSLDSDNKDA